MRIPKLTKCQYIYISYSWILIYCFCIENKITLGLILGLGIAAITIFSPIIIIYHVLVDVIFEKRTDNNKD